MPTLDQVLAYTEEVFGARAAKWLISDVRSLGDKAPVELLSTPEDRQKIMDVLIALDYGCFL